MMKIFVNFNYYQRRDARVRVHFIPVQTVFINPMISSLRVLIQISRLEHIAMLGEC